MRDTCVTLDLDWACEPAIEETLSTLENLGVSPTVFATHRSRAVESRMDHLEVGLHPFFDPQSSHGSTVEETVQTVLEIPHNLPAYRCHRFATSNASDQAMRAAGMLISSNVCTDLEVISPFRNRLGQLEVPIYLEDGGYLLLEHSLDELPSQHPGLKVLLIHPMHFALNTPHFAFMREIKDAVTRREWQDLSKESLERLRWKGRGIRDFFLDLLFQTETTPLGRALEERGHLSTLPLLRS